MPFEDFIYSHYFCILNYSFHSLTTSINLSLCLIMVFFHPQVQRFSFLLNNKLPHFGQLLSYPSVLQAGAFKFVPDGNAKPNLAAVSKLANAALILIPKISVPARSILMSAFIIKPLSRILSISSVSPTLSGLKFVIF